MPVAFDGVKRPRIQVYAGFGSAGDPGSTYIHLGIGPGLGTGLLAGPSADVDITADVRSISIGQRGRDSDIDAASPVTCQIVLSNRHGNYDPSNPSGPYWGISGLTANQQSLEDGTTTGWEVGGNCTLTSTTSQAQTGTRSLQLTSGASGGMWANTTTGTGGVPIAPGDAVKATGWLRSATRSVTGTICVMFWDAAGNYLGQVDSAGTATSTSAWTQVSVTTTAPSGAAFANVQVLYNAPIAASEVHYADNVTLQGSGIADGTPVKVRESWDGVGYDRFSGQLADITLDLNLTPDATATFTCTDGLENLGRAYLPVASIGRDGDSTGQRINYLADQALWPTVLRSVDTGFTDLGPTILGESALELMRKVESTEFGLLFVDGAGTLVFYDRYQVTTATRSTVVQATFADTGGSAVGITELSMARSRARTFNRVAITREPTPSEDEDFSDEPVEQVADDPASQATKGILAFPSEVGQLLRSDEDALAMAQGLVDRFGTVQNRISSLEVNALRGQWATLLPLGPLDRVAVSRDYGPNTISTELLIQGVAEEISVSPLSWTLSFSTSPPVTAPSAFILDTSQVGVDALGW